MIALVLRDQLRALLQQPLTRLKAGPFELDWKQTVEQVADDASSASVALSGPSYRGELEHLKTRAKVTPVPAVMGGFALIERELRRIAKSVSIADAETAAVWELAERLNAAGAINEATASAIEGLVTLRDLAARDDGSGLAVTTEKASEYVALVGATLFALGQPAKALTASEPG